MNNYLSRDLIDSLIVLPYESRTKPVVRCGLKAILRLGRFPHGERRKTEKAARAEGFDETILCGRCYAKAK